MEYKNLAILGGILFALVFTFTNSNFPILEGYTRLFILGCCLLSGILFLMNYVLVQPKPNIDTRHIPNTRQPIQQVPRQPSPPDSDIAMMMLSHPPLPIHPNTDVTRLGEKIKKLEIKKLVKYPEDDKEEDIFREFK